MANCAAQRNLVDKRDFRSWPITSDIALEPNVGFRGTADIVRSEHKADR